MLAHVGAAADSHSVNSYNIPTPFKAYCAPQHNGYMSVMATIAATRRQKTRGGVKRDVEDFIIPERR